jgi:hypothetical protein
MCYRDTNLLGCHIKKHVHHTVVIGIFMNTLICDCNNVFDEWVSEILFECFESFKTITLTENGDKKNVALWTLGRKKIEIKKALTNYVFL